MPSSLRIEIFPSDLQRMLTFYTEVLHFKLIKHEGDYAYLNRDDIYIGAIENQSQESRAEKEAYRRPMKGIEIVIEVDELEKERDFILAHGYTLDEDLKLQEWGLKDFRLVDPDGYYLRFTTHSPKRDGKGDIKGVSEVS